MKKPDVQDAIQLLDAAMRNGAQAKETVQRPDVVEALQLVGCDIAARPGGAPGFEDIVPYLRAMHREPQRLTVEFDAVAGDRVRAFVEAERTCCSDLVFDVLPGDPPVMRIDASSDLIDMVARWMTPES